METPRPLFNTSDHVVHRHYDQFINGKNVYILIISCLEIPMICLAMYAFCSLVKSKQATPVFVINLLISDLIQIVFMLLVIVLKIVYGLEQCAWLWVSLTGFYFMTCIAVERYVLIAHPIWHRSHHSVKCLVCTSIIGWFIPVIVIYVFLFDLILVCVVPFISYAVIVLCFIGSCRSLSHSVSLTPRKKQLVLGPLFFVVMSYTFLILPFIICMFLWHKFRAISFNLLYFTLGIYLLNPLVDCLLYVFMRSDIENIVRTPLCCSRPKRVQTETRLTTVTE